jgi:hypothetical protein
VPHSLFFLLIVGALVVAAMLFALSTPRIRRVLDQVERLEART